MGAPPAGDALTPQASSSPAPEGGPASEEELAALRRREGELRAQLEVVRGSLRELERELGAELQGWLRAEAALEGGELARELRRARAQLAELRASRALRLGQAALEPLRRVRDLGRRARVWWRPAPLGPARPARPFDKYERLGAYHWEYLSTKPWYQQRVRALTDWVEPGFRCLDLGCGDAAVAAQVAGRCREVVGVDADPRALRLARERLDRAGVGNVRLLEVDLAALTGLLGPQRFDLVYALDCIEHLARPERLLELMQRHLRPEGLAVVGTPLFVGEAAVSPYHVRELTAEQLEGLLVPRFRKLGVLRLPAPRPDAKGELPLRYYMFFGRRRSWASLWT